MANGYKIRAESRGGHEFLSDVTYPTREAAREQIRKDRRRGKWEGCRVFTTPWSSGDAYLTRDGSRWPQ